MRQRPSSGTPQDATLILVAHSHSDHYAPADLVKVRNAQTRFCAPPDVVATKFRCARAHGECL